MNIKIANIFRFYFRVKKCWDEYNTKEKLLKESLIGKGRDGSVGIATRYGLEGPGIESRWGTRFSVPVQTGPGIHPASYTVGTGSFLGVKRQGGGVDHPPPSTAEVEGRVELYICSPSGLSWPVIGRTLPLPLPLLLIGKELIFHILMCLTLDSFAFEFPVTGFVKSWLTLAN